MKYLVQAILIDGSIETVTDSIKTEDFERTLDFVMKRHKSSFKHLYIVMDIESQEIIKRTNKNRYMPIKPLNVSQCWKMVNRCDSHEKIQIAIKWLEKANITTEQFDELMDALAYISRELYRTPN